ncbi:plasminogen receptor (KT)-like [Rhopilema esculentum]|uniref:plasminogen receptor (KT)-like n=1 Tax=Rhopilema esculentum TaxID=499914 RepID=UPI0031D143D9|eukprot:gene4410-20637_t
MGGYLGKAMKDTMDENMKKNQEFMLASQKMQMDRQMTMQKLMIEKQMATKVAMAREMFDWLGSFYALASVGMFVGFAKSKKPTVLMPFVPLTFIVAYQAHLAYGNKIKRIRDEAENILKEERDLVALPGGPVTFEAVEKARQSLK